MRTSDNPPDNQPDGGPPKVNRAQGDSAAVVPLQRSNDTKVAFDLTVDKAGRTHVVVPNTHGLPALVSCPGRTETCAGAAANVDAADLEQVKQQAVDLHGGHGPATHWNRILPTHDIAADADCYVIADLRRGTEENNCWANWQQIRPHLHDQQMLTQILNCTLDEFAAEADHAGVTPVYRWHWDGDIPTVAYAHALRTAAQQHPDMPMWLYTRSLFAIPILTEVEHLVVYVSADRGNLPQARKVVAAHPNVHVAAFGQNDSETAQLLRDLGRDPAPICPVDTGKLPTATQPHTAASPQPGGTAVGACAMCGLCVHGRSDIRFTVTKQRFTDETTRRRLAARTTFDTAAQGRQHLLRNRSTHDIRLFDATMGAATRVLGVEPTFRKHYAAFRDGHRVLAAVWPRQERTLLCATTPDPAVVLTQLHDLHPHVSARDISEIGHMCPGNVELAVAATDAVPAAQLLLQHTPAGETGRNT